MVRTREGRVVDILEADINKGVALIELVHNGKQEIVNLSVLVADGGMDEIKADIEKYC